LWAAKSPGQHCPQRSAVQSPKALDRESCHYFIRDLHHPLDLATPSQGACTIHRSRVPHHKGPPIATTSLGVSTTQGLGPRRCVPHLHKGRYLHKGPPKALSPDAVAHLGTCTWGRARLTARARVWSSGHAPGLARDLCGECSMTCTSSGGLNEKSETRARRGLERA